MRRAPISVPPAVTHLDRPGLYLARGARDGEQATTRMCSGWWSSHTEKAVCGAPRCRTSRPNERVSFASLEEAGSTIWDAGGRRGARCWLSWQRAMRWRRAAGRRAYGALDRRHHTTCVTDARCKSMRQTDEPETTDIPSSAGSGSRCSWLRAARSMCRQRIPTDGNIRPPDAHTSPSGRRRPVPPEATPVSADGDAGCAAATSNDNWFGLLGAVLATTSSSLDLVASATTMAPLGPR